MSDQRDLLTRRRVLVALGTVGVGGAIGGAGTFAAFSDETTSDEKLNAGTLSIGKSDSTLNFTSSEIKPGDSGTSSVTLEKSGTVTGDLSLSVTDVTSNEDGGSSGNGSLDDQVEFQLWIDKDPGDSDDTDAGLNSDGSFTSDASKGGAAYAAGFDGETWDTESTDSPGFISDFQGPVDFVVAWEFVDDTTDDSLDNNDAQGDTLDVEFTFTLTQQ